MRGDESKACRKAGYPTKAKALSHAKRAQGQQRKSSDVRGVVGVAACDQCGLFHVHFSTSRPVAGVGRANGRNTERRENDSDD